jgi:hypothetical protein
MLTTGQLALSFGSPRRRSVTDRHVEEQLLVNLLRDKEGWVLSSTIEAALGWDDRKVREVASESLFVVGRIGSPGYKFIHNCTAEEYEHFRRSRRSSARKLIASVLQKDRVFFGRIQPQA